MFLLRGSVASLAVFFLVYAALYALLLVFWRRGDGGHSAHSAAALYSLRVSPLVAAFGLVALFTLPSFLYFEPYFLDEKIGTGAFVLAAAGAVIVLAGLFRCARAWGKTSRRMAQFLSRSRRLEFAGGIRVYELQDENPVMFVAGVLRPRLLVSTGAIALLDPEEMQAAVWHEFAHIHRGDNLKKLLLHFCALPGLASLEQAWRNAAEFAADEAAQRDESAALGLASALLKMARAAAPSVMPELGTTLVPADGASVSARVERLLSEKRPARSHRQIFWWFALASAALAVGVNYAWALRQAHELTEFLVR